MPERLVLGLTGPQPDRLMSKTSPDDPFPDGKSVLMLAAARLRHVAGTTWGTRRSLDINRLAEASEAA